MIDSMALSGGRTRTRTADPLYIEGSGEAQGSEGGRAGTRHRADTTQQRESSSVGWVYAIQSVIGGPFKVGWSASPELRLVDLQVGNPYPLHVVATTPANRKYEAELHVRLHPYRARGEWFHPHPEAIEIVDRRIGLGDIPLLAGDVRDLPTPYSGFQGQTRDGLISLLEIIGPASTKNRDDIERMRDVAARLEADPANWFDHRFGPLERVQWSLRELITAVLGPTPTAPTGEDE